jgi:hypothetical protein
MAKLVSACVGLGALSLALPSELSYDPWAWLVWGREIVHLELDTAGGPSWKPLPVLVTALASPLSALHDGLPEAVWMTLARAGSLLALAFAFRLTRRRRMELHRQLAEAVCRAGGAEAVNRFGPASVNRALETHLAWRLARPIEEIETGTGQGVVFSSFREFLAGRRPIRRPADAIQVARAGSWNVYLRRSVYITFAGSSQPRPG